MEEKPAITTPGKLNNKQKLSRKATWNAVMLEFERIAGILVDLTILSNRNNRRNDPTVIIDFLSGLDCLYAELRGFLNNDQIASYDKIFTVMYQRIFNGRMRNKQGAFDSSLYTDLDKIYKDLKLIHQRAQLGIPYKTPQNPTNRLNYVMGVTSEDDVTDGEEW